MIEFQNNYLSMQFYETKFMNFEVPYGTVPPIYYHNVSFIFWGSIPVLYYTMLCSLLTLKVFMSTVSYWVLSITTL